MFGDVMVTGVCKKHQHTHNKTACSLANRNMAAAFGILTTVLLIIQIFWDVILVE